MKPNWEKIEEDIDDGFYSLPVDNGPDILFEYYRVSNVSFCPGGNFVGIFLSGPPIHTRVPYKTILIAAKAIKAEILHRNFGDVLDR
jgi:hypothetical protein